jgi:hypothetical protein
MTLRALVPLLVSSALLAPAAAAASTEGDSWSRAAAGPLWAKVNVCEPGEVGVRASLPGDGGGGGMSARFTLQWLNPATQAWENVRGTPVSPRIDAGPADVLWSQVGFTFQVDPLPPGVRFTLRGVADLSLGGGRAETLTTAGTCVLGG